MGILIIRNIKRENPGLIEDILKEHRLEYSIVDFDKTTKLDYLQYSAVIVLGGPESANDTTEKMINELSFVKTAVEAGVPYLGICLGLQVFVKAMGGNVVKCKVPETGFHDGSNSPYRIMLTPDGREDRLFDNLPETLPVFQLHGETVEMTPGMTLLAKGDICRNQIIKYGTKAYGIQGHFELTDVLLRDWIELDPDLRKCDADDLRSDFQSIKENYYSTARILFENFLSIAGLF